MLAFDIVQPSELVAANAALSADFDLDCNLQPRGFPVKSVSAFISKVGSSVNAANQLYPILGCLVNPKPPVYRIVVPNPLFPRADSPVLIPRNDKHAQQNKCAVYWNASKTVCLKRHAELNAHNYVDRSDPLVQILDTKWVFDLKICPETRMIERFKARIVANEQITFSVLIAMTFMHQQCQFANYN